MPLPNQAKMAPAPRSRSVEQPASVPSQQPPPQASPQPLTPEQQMILLQQQQLQIMQQAAMNTKKTRQSIDAVFWFIVILVVAPIALIILGMVFDSFRQAFGF